MSTKPKKKTAAKSTKPDDFVFESNLPKLPEELPEFNFGNYWFKVVYSQSKDEKGNWIDDISKPMQALVGKGKNVNKWNFEEVLKFYDSIKNRKDDFTKLLLDERSKIKSDGVFD